MHTKKIARRLRSLHHTFAKSPRRPAYIAAAIFAAAGSFFVFRSFAATPANADLNGDGVINLSDLSILLSNYHKSGPNGDINSDGTVNLTDLSILLSGFGQSVNPTPVPPTPPPGGNATAPGGLLNLTNWYITLPVPAGSGSSSPKTVNQPTLNTYSDEWFHLNTAKNGVVFHVKFGAGATTTNSSNPRSELREMTNNGKDMAGWSSSSGTSTMTIIESVDHLTVVKPHVVVGQIHDSTDDVTVFRMEGNSPGGTSDTATLYITDGNITHGFAVDSNYKLGTKFSVKFEVSGGVVKYYYNGALLNYTQKKSFSGAYFKAGNYLQSNPSDGKSSGESTNSFADVSIYDLKVTHQP